MPKPNRNPNTCGRNSYVSNMQYLACFFGNSLFFLSIPVIQKDADLWQHMADYSKGIVDTRHVVYELSLTGLFIFLSTKSLELAKWR